MKYLKPALGIFAFIIGGLVAREKSGEVYDTVDNFVHRQKPRVNKAKESVQEIAQTEPAKQ